VSQQRIPAILLREYGGPERLTHSEIVLAPPGPGEIRIRQTAIGVNFHDIYVRTGLYRTLALPGIPGIEAVGLVEQVGEGVSGIFPGERVGYVSSSYGGYATVRNLPAAQAVRLPPELTDAQAAGTLMRALTACVLLRQVHKVAPGEVVVIHAAAGGMGQLLCRAGPVISVRG
jgi:NADPH2:quinone reductase